jgi:hypothetical protein
MQAKTIEIIIKVVEIIANIFVSSKNEKGGHKNDGTGSSKKK